jgi:hypothetical protein
MSIPDRQVVGSADPGRRSPAAAAAHPESRPRHRALRLLSLLLLLAALGSFGFSMVRISFSPALIAELQQLPSLGSLPAACVNGGIAAYSGLALAAGGSPHVNAACLTHVRDAGQANLGIQPLALIALLFVVAAAAVTVWGPRGQRLATSLLGVAAMGLLVANTLNLAHVFAGHFGQGASAIASGPDLGLWVVASLLLVVVVAQIGSAGLGWARQALAPLEEVGETRHR